MADIVVNTTVDEADGSIVDGDISLRDALDAAQAGDRILFDSAVFSADSNPLNNASIDLSLGALTIGQGITIDGDVNGDGVSDVEIDGSGNGGARIFTVATSTTGVSLESLTIAGANATDSGGALYVGSGAAVDISDSVFANNLSADYGGAIDARGASTLTITNSTFTGNQSESGAIDSSGSLTITDSNLSGNTGTGAYGGGALYIRDGSATVSGTTITGNTANGLGAGVYLYAGSLSISNSTISGNTAGEIGGGVSIGLGTQATILNSTISGNSAGEYGGAISSLSGSTMTIVGSTISGNSAETGAIDSSGDLTLVNSTLSQNYASGSYGGGAIYVRSGTTSLVNSTVSGNYASSDGGGIYNSTLGTLNVTNSIVAGNQAGGLQNDIFGPVDASNGANIFGSVVTGSVVGDITLGGANTLADVFESVSSVTVGGATFDAGTLALAGGTTATINIRADGLAINAGDAADLPTETSLGADADGDGSVSGIVDVDQQGQVRIIAGGLDIGAVEATDLRLVEEQTDTGQFGNKYSGNFDPDGLISAGFANTGNDLLLRFDGFDVDFNNEVEVLLNGASLGLLDAGVNEGLAPYEMILSQAQQVAGENLLQFAQNINDTYKWGVTNLSLIELTRLAADTPETGTFGNKYNGQNDADGIAAFVFTATGSDLMMSLDGFDIDSDDELEIVLNGTSLGFLDTGVNDGLQSYQVTLSADDQVAGDNVLEFRQAVNPTWKWGVTNLELSEVSTLELDVISDDPFGNRFNGLTDPDGIATYVFAGTGTDLRLALDGFDIDFDDEVEVLLNGASLGFLDAGVNEGTQFYEIGIAAGQQVAGSNMLQFRQAQNLNFKWGGENLLLTEEASADFRLARGTVETGSWGNKFNGQTDADGSIFAAFVGTGETLDLSFNGYDIDFDDEVEVLLNGASLGFLDTGVNNGQVSYRLTLAPGDQMIGDNVLEFRQALNTTFKWGVTDLLLTEIPTLEVSTTDTSAYGNNFAGQSDPDGIVTFAFTGTGDALQLNFDGFDIDFDDEVEVFLNGASQGFLDAGVNNGQSPYQLAFGSADLVVGENSLEFHQATNPNWKWGVTDLLLTEVVTLDLDVTENGEFGNNYSGQFDPDGAVAFAFTGTGTDLQLDLNGYDVDSDDEIEIFLNGTSLGFLDTGVDNGEQAYQQTLTAADQVVGENVLEFHQALDLGFRWGVTDLLLTEIA